MSAFTVGVFDGLSALLTALWVSGDKSKRREGISPLFMAWLSFCMLVGEFANIQLCFNMHESITVVLFSPAVLVNLVNLCSFCIHKCMSVNIGMQRE